MSALKCPSCNRVFQPPQNQRPRQMRCGACGADIRFSGNGVRLIEENVARSGSGLRYQSLFEAVGACTAALGVLAVVVVSISAFSTVPQVPTIDDSNATIGLLGAHTFTSGESREINQSYLDTLREAEHSENESNSFPSNTAATSMRHGDSTEPIAPQVANFQTPSRFIGPADQSQLFGSDFDDRSPSVATSRPNSGVQYSSNRYYDYYYRPPVGEHYVSGYVRRDGTYVQGHMKTDSDDSFWNNWSSEGNINPYTGAVGHRNTSSGHSTGGPIYVRGYVRSDGTYVSGHYRSR